MAGDQHVRTERSRTYLVDEARLLAARYEVVDEHAEPSIPTRAELLDDGGQVVDAAEVLDGDPDVAQVVTPDLLDQLRVVAALDVDPGRDRDPGCRRLGDARPGRRVGRAGRRLPRRGHELDRLALQEEPLAHRERAALQLAVLEHDDAVLPRDHGTAEPGQPLLHDHVALDGHLRDDWLLRPVLRREHVSVAVDGHPSRLGQ